MFYKDLFTPDELQLFVKLTSWRLLEREVPKFMESSLHVMKVRHSVIRHSRPSVVNASILPRIRSKTVLRLIAAIRQGNDGLPCEQLSVLFNLGLGVPKQKDLAEYIKAYSCAEDEGSVMIKQIRKMVVNYQRNVRRCLGNYRHIPPAAYLAHMAEMRNFIGYEEKGYPRGVAIPEGSPVVLVYSKLLASDAEFSLADAFLISPEGYPVPFSHIVMRKEFKVPKTIKSAALAQRSMYALVMGVMHWPDEDHNTMMKYCRTLDSEDYTVLLDSVRSLRSPELDAAYESRVVDRDIHDEMLERVRQYGRLDSLTTKEQRLLNAAQAYFEGRREAMSKLGELEKKETRALERSGFLTRAKFCAVDVGLIEDRTKFVGVRSKIEQVDSILRNWSFDSLSMTENKTCEMYYKISTTGRSWSM